MEYIFLFVLILPSPAWQLLSSWIPEAPVSHRNPFLTEAFSILLPVLSTHLVTNVIFVVKVLNTLES